MLQGLGLYPQGRMGPAGTPDSMMGSHLNPQPQCSHSRTGTDSRQQQGKALPAPHPPEPPFPMHTAGLPPTPIPTHPCAPTWPDNNCDMGSLSIGLWLQTTSSLGSRGTQWVNKQLFFLSPTSPTTTQPSTTRHSQGEKGGRQLRDHLTNTNLLKPKVGLAPEIQLQPSGREPSWGGKGSSLPVGEWGWKMSGLQT